MVPVDEWPTGEKISVAFTCGTAPGPDVRAWLLIQVGTLYEHREAWGVGTVKWSAFEFVDGLLGPAVIDAWWADGPCAVPV